MQKVLDELSVIKKSLYDINSIFSISNKDTSTTLQELKQYKDLVNVIPYFIVVHTDKKILYANQAYLKTINKSLSDIVGKPSSQIFDKIENLSLVHCHPGNLPTESISLDQSNLDCSDLLIKSILKEKTYFFNTHHIPVMWNEKAALMTVMVDVTNRIILEKQIVNALLKFLSKEEKRAFMLFAEFKEIREIAKEMNVLPQTIYSYKHRIISKTGIEDFTKLLAMYNFCNQY